MGEPKSILVVDDEDLVLLNLSAFLEDEGFEVITAVSGEQALQKVRRLGTVDLAIVDIGMPVMDGNSLIQILHSEHDARVFLVYTGNREYLPPPQLVRAGIGPADVIYKPMMDMNVLLQAIQAKFHQA